MPMNGVALGVLGAGVVFMFAGIKGMSIPGALSDIVQGKNPKDAVANQWSITSNGGSSSTSASATAGTAPTAAAQNMLTFALTARGKPYSQNNPGRFGPNEYDCSGLIWAAARHAGLGIPGGPSDPAAAIVDPEIQYFASLVGSKVITHAPDIQAGDVLGFNASDAGTLGTSHLLPNGKLQVGNTQVISMGHIGIAVNNTQYMSAYDTPEGCLVKPIAGDEFVCAVRIA
jgi:cell wall-associated NlpC family hydrolase